MRKTFLILVIPVVLICLDPAVPAKTDDLCGPVSVLGSRLDDQLTESAAIRFALQRSRNLELLNTDVDIAEYRRDAAGTVDNPELRLENAMDRRGENRSDEYRLGIRWRPPRYGELSDVRLDEAVTACEKRIEALQYRHLLINRVRKAHAEVLMKDALARLAEQQMDLETRRLEIVGEMVGLGQRTIVYKTKARMWHAETRHEYAQSLRRRKSARLRLAQMTGLSEDTPLSEEIIPGSVPDVDSLVETALLHRPEVELANLLTERAIHRSRVEKFKLTPRLTFLDWSYAFEDNRDDRMEIRMGIDLPVFRWRTDYVEARKLAVKRREIESSAVLEQITDEIREKYETVLDRLSDWQNFNNDISVMIAETEQVIRQAGENPVLAPDEVLELDLVLVDTHRILVEKRFRLCESLADLYLAMGVEDYDPVTGQNEPFETGGGR